MTSVSTFRLSPREASEIELGKLNCRNACWTVGRELEPASGTSDRARAAGLEKHYILPGSVTQHHAPINRIEGEADLQSPLRSAALRAPSDSSIPTRCRTSSSPSPGHR